MTPVALDEYQVISKLSEFDQPLLGECVLVMGDGTPRVQFKNGRAICPAKWAHLLAQRGDVEIIGYDADTDPYNPDATNPGPLPGVTEIEEEQPAVEAGRTTLDEVTDGHPSKARENTEADVAAAEDYLREEGLEVPPRAVDDEATEAAKAAGVLIPEGFQVTTEDGEPRCLAAKGDRTQCANVAEAGTHSCGIPAHRSQVTERQA